MINKLLDHPLYQLFYSKRRYFLWVSVCALIVGAIMLYLVPKQYTSYTLLFPSKQFSPSKLVIEVDAGNQLDYMSFGFADDCERLIDLLNSDALKLEIANRYGLWDRWKIKKKSESALNTLQKRWDEKISVKRTEYNSVRVEATDFSPQGAADLVNGMVQYSDTIKFRMNKPLVDYVLRVVKTEYDSTLARLKVLQDTLANIRMAGVLDYKEMLRAFMRRYTKAVAKADIDGMRRLETELTKLNRYGSAYLFIEKNLEEYSTKYPDIRRKYDEALVNSESMLPGKFVVDKALPDSYWTKPRPLFFILNILLLANVFLCVIFYLMQRFKGHTTKQQAI